MKNNIRRSLIVLLEIRLALEQTFNPKFRQWMDNAHLSPEKSFFPDTLKNKKEVAMNWRELVKNQFGKPSGPLGWLAGKIMTHSFSNRTRIDWTLSLLDLKTNEQALEIGYGPGLAIEQACHLGASVTGLDHSSLMFDMARSRNRKLIESGKVVLLQGCLDHLEKISAQFDKIWSINSIQFWTQPEHVVQCLFGLVKPGGLVALTLQPRCQKTTEPGIQSLGKEIEALLGKCGFRELTVHFKPMEPVTAVCVTGRKP